MTAISPGDAVEGLLDLPDDLIPLAMELLVDYSDCVPVPRVVRAMRAADRALDVTNTSSDRRLPLVELLVRRDLDALRHLAYHDG